MSRKTVEVEWLKEEANKRIRTAYSEEARVAIAFFLEDILHRSGNYNGYNYVGWVEGGCQQWINNGKPKDKDPYIGDTTLRVYY